MTNPENPMRWALLFICVLSCKATMPAETKTVETKTEVKQQPPPNSVVVQHENSYCSSSALGVPGEPISIEQRTLPGCKTTLTKTNNYNGYSLALESLTGASVEWGRLSKNIGAWTRLRSALDLQTFGACSAPTFDFSKSEVVLFSIEQTNNQAHLVAFAKDDGKTVTIAIQPKDVCMGIRRPDSVDSLLVQMSAGRALKIIECPSVPTEPCLAP
jgi:hypothetical protein